MEAEKRFNAAVNVIQGLPKDGSFQPSNEMKLKFYGHYKQATQGKCTQARPSFWDPIGRAKHDAWAALEDTSREEAMNGYVDALMQIIETMNFSADVESFMEMLGPFYEFVEDKISAPDSNGGGSALGLNSSEQKEAEARNLGEILAGADKYPLNDLEMESSSSEAGCSEGESVHSLEDMLGQFVPPSDSFNYNSVQPDPHFIRQMQRGSSEDCKETGTFSSTYQAEAELAEKLTTSSLSFGKIDLNHNSFVKQEERFLSEMRETHSSLASTRGLMKEIHQYKLNQANKEPEKVNICEDTGPEDIENLSKELSQTEIDRMLDRFEGYTQPQPPQLKPPPGPNLLGLDNTLHQPMDQYEDESEEEVFEDSVDFTDKPPAPERIMVKSKGYSSLSSAFSEDNPKQPLGLHGSTDKHLRAPCHERKISGALRRELEDDQILIVNSQTNPETILMSNMSCETHKEVDRYMETVIMQLSRDLALVNSNLGHVNNNIEHMTDSIDHMTARMGSLENNVVQITSRINTLEYLVQVLLSREESWFDRKATTLTVVPLIGFLAVVVAKVIYSRRR